MEAIETIHASLVDIITPYQVEFAISKLLNLAYARFQNKTLTIQECRAIQQIFLEVERQKGTSLKTYFEDPKVNFYFKDEKVNINKSTDDFAYIARAYQHLKEDLEYYITTLSKLKLEKDVVWKNIMKCCEYYINSVISLRKNGSIINKEMIRFISDLGRKILYTQPLNRLLPPIKLDLSLTLKQSFDSLLNLVTKPLESNPKNLIYECYRVLILLTNTTNFLSSP